MAKRAKTKRVVGVDHIVIRVSDYARSKVFYGRLFDFLGMEISDEYDDAIGWTNDNTRFWIGPADARGRKHKHRIGEVGLHHYAFELRTRADVDDLQKFLEQEGVEIVDPADEYYEDYYAVFFLDPDGLKLEGMKYGEKTAGLKKKTPADLGKGVRGGSIGLNSRIQGGRYGSGRAMPLRGDHL